MSGGPGVPEPFPPFLETTAPPWAARGLASILLALFVVIAAASLLVRVPETVTGTFVLHRAGGRLQAELRLPRETTALVREGQRVKLLYDAFPYQRYGVKAATLRWVGPTGDDAVVLALAELEDDAVMVGGQPRALGPGLGGRARVLVGRRTLASYALEPLRQLRETLGDQ